MATQKDLAEHLFISPQAVGNLVKNGIITIRKGRSPVDIDFARREYLEHLRKTQNHYKKSGNSGDIVEESTRLKKFQADKAELEVNQLEGKLIPASLVRDYWSGLVGNAHAKLLNLPTTLAARLLAADNINEVIDIHRKGLHEALEELSGDGIPAEYAERTETSTRAVETTDTAKDI